MAKVNKQKNLFKFSFYEKLFMIDVLVFVGDLDKFEAYVDKNFSTHIAGLKTLEGCFSRLVKEEDGEDVSYYVIYLRDLNDFYTLSHELLHLCREALDDRGISVDLNRGDETFAYLHTYLMKAIWSKISKKINSLQKKKKVVKIEKDGKH